VAVDAPRRQVYVASFADNSVAVLDARTGTAQGVIPVGHRPNDVVVDARTGHAFVTNWDDGTVSVIDTRRQTVLRTVPVVAAIDSPAGQVLVANFTGDSVCSHQAGTCRRDLGAVVTWRR
jgi:YVTN family beta-propeller protein